MRVKVARFAPDEISPAPDEIFPSLVSMEGRIVRGTASLRGKSRGCHIILVRLRWSKLALQEYATVYIVRALK